MTCINDESAYAELMFGINWAEIGNSGACVDAGAQGQSLLKALGTRALQLVQCPTLRRCVGFRQRRHFADCWRAVARSLHSCGMVLNRHAMEFSFRGQPAAAADAEWRRLLPEPSIFGLPGGERRPVGAQIQTPPVAQLDKVGT